MATKCKGRTKRGEPCPYKPTKGSEYCKPHDKIYKRKKEKEETGIELKKMKKDISGAVTNSEYINDEPHTHLDTPPAICFDTHTEPENTIIHTESENMSSHTKLANTHKNESLVATSEDILSANYWKNTNAFKSIKDKETQIKYYKKKGSCEEVLQLVSLESKPFGSESEKIIQEIFNLGPRTSTQNDATRNGKKIEIKCARYWAGKDNCVWQHLEPEHDYEYALFALLDFQSWKVWGIKKSLLMGEMRREKIVTFQGKQGWWVRKSAIISYLTPIKTIAELDMFLQS